MEIAGILELMFRFFIFSMTVFTLTSAILYSELVSDLRVCWIDYFKEAKNKHIRKLQFLGICSLCLSFHVANIIQWLFMPNSGIEWYIGYSLTACGITWILCTLVNKLQWNKALNEQIYNENTRLFHEDNI